MRLVPEKCRWAAIQDYCHKPECRDVSGNQESPKGSASAWFWAIEVLYCRSLFTARRHAFAYRVGARVAIQSYAVLCGVMLTLCLGANAHGASALAISLSSPTHLGAVSVGEPIKIDVSLGGVLPGVELDSLATTIVFDGGLVAKPVFDAGPIVPLTLHEALDFLMNSDDGRADATFLTFGADSADHIAANGVFFSFIVLAEAPGAGEFAIDFGGATRFNPANPNDPTVLQIASGPSLPFTIVPEPNSLMLLTGLAGSLAMMRRCLSLGRI